MKRRILRRERELCVNVRNVEIIKPFVEYVVVVFNPKADDFIWQSILYKAERNVHSRHRPQQYDQ